MPSKTDCTLLQIIIDKTCKYLYMYTYVVPWSDALLAGRREAAAENAEESEQEKEGSDRQQHQRPKEKETGEQSQLQRRCQYAMELLAAIRFLIADFRDIEEQLNKGDKKRQKGNRTVNMVVERSDEGECLQVVS